MFKVASVLAFTIAIAASTAVLADGTVKHYGRSTVKYRSADVSAVASYDYSQRHHDGAWLLIEFAIQAMNRIVVNRSQFTLVGPGEQTVPLATYAEFAADRPVLNQLLQNARTSRQPLGGYFSTRPPVRTIRFFAGPGDTIDDTVASHMDEVATGDLLFKSPTGNWPAGEYRLVLDHPKARAELPIALK
jgi:hypothetical protein